VILEIAANNYRYFNILRSVIFCLICGTNFANACREYESTGFYGSLLTIANGISSEKGQVS
jgi:hypothetical protein